VFVEKYSYIPPTVSGSVLDIYQFAGNCPKNDWDPRSRRCHIWYSVKLVLSNFSLLWKSSIHKMLGATARSTPFAERQFTAFISLFAVKRTCLRTIGRGRALYLGEPFFKYPSKFDLALDQQAHIIWWSPLPVTVYNLKGSQLAHFDVLRYICLLSFFRPVRSKRNSESCLEYQKRRGLNLYKII
jgi:hypothetical protein